MNLPMCLEAYFGRLEDEAVAAVLYSDGSSYERLQQTWADERTLPSEADLLSYWEQTGEALVQAWEAAQEAQGAEAAQLEAALLARVELLEQALLDVMLSGGV